MYDATNQLQLLIWKLDERIKELEDVFDRTELAVLAEPPEDEADLACAALTAMTGYIQKNAGSFMEELLVEGGHFGSYHPASGSFRWQFGRPEELIAGAPAPLLLPFRTVRSSETPLLREMFRVCQPGLQGWAATSPADSYPHYFRDSAARGVRSGGPTAWPQPTQFQAYLNDHLQPCVYAAQGEVSFWLALWRWIVRVRCADDASSGPFWDDPSPSGGGQELVERSWQRHLTDPDEGGSSRSPIAARWSELRRREEGFNGVNGWTRDLLSLRLDKRMWQEGVWGYVRNAYDIAETPRRTITDMTALADILEEQFGGVLELHGWQHLDARELLAAVHRTARFPILPYYYWSTLRGEPLEHFSFPLHRSWRYPARVPHVSGGVVLHPAVALASLGMRPLQLSHRFEAHQDDPSDPVNLEILARIDRFFRHLAAPWIDVAYYGRLVVDAPLIHRSRPIWAFLRDYVIGDRGWTRWTHDTLEQDDALGRIHHRLGGEGMSLGDAKALFIGHGDVRRDDVASELCPAADRGRPCSAERLNALAVALDIVEEGVRLVEGPVLLPVQPGFPFLLALAAFCQTARWDQVDGERRELARPEVTLRTEAVGANAVSTLTIRLFGGRGAPPALGLKRRFDELWSRRHANRDPQREAVEHTLTSALIDLQHARLYGLCAREGDHIAPFLYRGAAAPVADITFGGDTVTLTWTSGDRSVDGAEAWIRAYDHGGGLFSQPLERAAAGRVSWTSPTEVDEVRLVDLLRDGALGSEAVCVLHVDDGTWEDLTKDPGRCRAAVFVRVSSVAERLAREQIAVHHGRVYLKTRTEARRLPWSELVLRLDALRRLTDPTPDAVRRTLGPLAPEFGDTAAAWEVERARLRHDWLLNGWRLALNPLRDAAPGLSSAEVARQLSPSLRQWCDAHRGRALDLTARGPYVHQDRLRRAIATFDATLAPVTGDAPLPGDAQAWWAAIEDSTAELDAALAQMKEPSL